MRSVRCDVCGTKALMAASQCPKCSHPFAVRDGFGELLPLAHCSTCNSDYPLHVGACRWCGTKPERAPIAPYVWKGVGMLVFAGLGFGAWLARDVPPTGIPGAPSQTTEATRAAPSPSDAPVAPQTLALGDTADTMPVTTSTVVVAADTLASDTVIRESAGMVAPAEPRIATETEPAVIDSAPAAVDPAPAREAPRPAPRAAPPPAPKRVVASRAVPPRVAPKGKAPRTASAPASRTASASKASKSAKARPRSTARWVNSVARSWVVVRADANPRARIVASVGPNTRVQLGESRGAWRRIRAKGFSGWVQHRAFSARSAGTGKAGRLAAR